MCSSDLAALGVSFQCVYKWIEKNRIPPAQAKRVVELRKSPPSSVTLSRFDPFVYGG